MSRHSGTKGYGHKIYCLGHGAYRLTWQWDKYYSGSRLRFPQGLHRDTDRAGGEQFAKKWGCSMPTTAADD